MTYTDIMIDPPWPKRKGGLRAARPNQGRSLDYTTMPVSEIFSLLDAKVFPKCGPIHNIWLWTIDSFLHESEMEMLTRGYKRHARLIWNKMNGVAPAFTVRYTHEYLCWFYKPSLTPIAKDVRGKFMTVFSEKARQHSRKPDAGYTMIQTLYPAGKYYDVFSRERRSGWDQFGDQTEVFNTQTQSVREL